jgi:hypothetical protein
VSRDAGLLLLGVVGDMLQRDPRVLSLDALRRHLLLTLQHYPFVEPSDIACDTALLTLLQLCCQLLAPRPGLIGAEGVAALAAEFKLVPLVYHKCLFDVPPPTVEAQAERPELALPMCKHEDTRTAAYTLIHILAACSAELLAATLTLLHAHHVNEPPSVW